MNDAVIGMRVHSGWGALVAVTGDAPGIEVLDRQRIVITDPQIPGSKQPYHFAAETELLEAERFLAKCIAISEELAWAAIRDVIRKLHHRDYQVTRAAILLASGRSLPALSEILVSHPLIHTAEGEFFRQAVSQACERLNLLVTGFRERDLDEQVQTAFGPVAPQLQQRIAGLGKSLGSPWTEDQKKATLAASIALSNGNKPREAA
jgi:hypothetical protein